MDVHGEGHVTLPMPIVSGEGTVFPPTIHHGELHIVGHGTITADGTVTPGTRRGLDERFVTNLRGNPGDRLHAYRETDLDDGVRLQELIDEAGEVVVMGIDHEDEWEQTT